MVQQHVKYNAIAPKVFLSLGALKNQLKVIYTILEVGDKQGFLNRYEDYKIIYTKREPQETPLADHSGKNLSSTCRHSA